MGTSNGLVIQESCVIGASGTLLADPVDASTRHAA